MDRGKRVEIKPYDDYKVEFTNDSQLIFLSSANKSIRGKRSELIGFYCSSCNCVHEDYPIKNVQFIGEGYQMCKEGYEKILELYINRMD